jgi:hypothetical protein
MAKKEVVTEVGMARLFNKLDKALGRGVLLEDMKSSYKTDHFWTSSINCEVIESTRLYQFENGVRIAQEIEEENGTRSIYTGGYPERRWSDPYSDKTTLYFVYSGDKPITDKKEAMELIRQATGIRLPRLVTPAPKALSFGGSTAHYEVVTRFENVGKKRSELGISYGEHHPGEDAMAREFIDIIERIDALKDEFVVETAADGLKGLRQVAFSLYKKFEQSLPKEERLDRKIISDSQASD